MLIDSHSHFDIIIEDNVSTEEDLIKSLRDNDIKNIVQISIDVNTLEWCRDFALRNEEHGVLYTLGIHPSSFADEVALNKLSNFLEKEMSSKNSHLLFGIGECGLDFYRMRQKEDMQRSSFEFQIDLALKYNLPVVVHLRDALNEGYDVLKRKSIQKGIMHCFPGDNRAAKKFLDLGFFISFAGNVTYNKALELHDSAKYVPLDRILLETDAPFLTPVPMRGKPNVPNYIKHTYKFVADLKKVSLSALEDSICTNFDLLVKR